MLYLCRQAWIAGLFPVEGVAVSGKGLPNSWRRLPRRVDAGGQRPEGKSSRGYIAGVADGTELSR